MKTITLTTLFSLFVVALQAQSVEYYQNSYGDRHLIGEFPIEVLKTDSLFKEWFQQGYDLFESTVDDLSWAKSLEAAEVDIYLGTWCGDSKRWVPRFVKLWEEAGLSTSQLKFVALYDNYENKYKQGPDGEETGLGIHRVPTFIFRKHDKEIARIVESPVNDLVTDVAQIALGYPSEPNYRGASFMLELFATKTHDEIDASFYEYINKVYRLVKKPSELNTLGSVLLDAGRIEDALTVFYYNCRIYPYDPNTYDSYGEALALAGKTKEAIQNYEKVLLLDRSNQEAWKKRGELLASQSGE